MSCKSLAGTNPRDVNPLTLRVLEEIGVPTDGPRTKGVGEFLGSLPVRSLTIVCADAERKCPKDWPGMAERLFRPFEDPAAAALEQRLAKLRKVRDGTEARVT